LKFFSIGFYKYVAPMALGTAQLCAFASLARDTDFVACSRKRSLSVLRLCVNFISPRLNSSGLVVFSFRPADSLLKQSH
jgi:hypothetical protein